MTAEKRHGKAIRKTAVICLLFALIITLKTSCENVIRDGTEQGYAIGSIGPAGGWIFYINLNAFADGWTYLEAAPEDLGTGIIWSGAAGEIGTTGTEIGSGEANTFAIINQFGHSGSAAQDCTFYTGGGYTDWFLPSRDELFLMFNNLYHQGIGNMSPGPYWSSSEFNDTLAWWVNEAGENAMSKNDAELVRAVRYF